MMDLPAILTAVGGLLVPCGGAIAFIWNKVEKRFAMIERDLRDCEHHKEAGNLRESKQITVIELLCSALKRADPGAWELTRSHEILDDLKQEIFREGIA